jgi:D-alanyl-lipoteichoic acid acyltransferase DltB (MBOAT superfamily)
VRQAIDCIAVERLIRLAFDSYIYIPLGGSGNAIVSIVLVFTFVALWHDLSLKLLTWGWLVSLFILPEIIAAKVLSKDRYGSKWWYRHICAFGGVINVLMMMTANLVGFVIGTDGIRYLWKQMLNSWGGECCRVMQEALC